jgi:hypothetical protein
MAGERSAATTVKPSSWKYALSWPVPAPISSSRAPGASLSRNACRSATFQGSLVSPSRQAARPSWAARSGSSTSSYRTLIPVIVGGPVFQRSPSELAFDALGERGLGGVIDGQAAVFGHDGVKLLLVVRHAEG